MKLSSIPLAIAIFVILFGGIGITTSLNWWQTESTKVPARYSDGEAAGEFNPADIRGSYTFGDINTNFGIPLEDLRMAFRLPAGTDTASFQVKSLEDQYADLPVEMGTGAVRLFTAFYKGLPFDLASNSDTYIFAEAANILHTKGMMTPEQTEFLPNHTLTADLQLPQNSEITPSSAELPVENPISTQAVPTEHTVTVGTITGKTTFQDLLSWGMTPDMIAAVLGEPMPDAGMIIKDYSTNKGLEFSSLKTSLQVELDKNK
jgi:hypothetical protein